MNRELPLRVFLLVVILSLVGCDRAKVSLRPGALPPEVMSAVAQQIHDAVDVKALPVAFKDQRELQTAWKEMAAFYQKREYRPVWFTSRGLRPQGEELIQAIAPLGVDGLDVRRYQPERLAALVAGMKPVKSFEDPESQRRLVELETELTYTYLSLAAHLATGRLQPEKLSVEWYTKPRNVDLDARLGAALNAETPGEIVKVLRSYNPPYPEYERLRKALVDYHAIAGRGGWGTVPPGSTLKTGDRGSRVAALRARLAASGDLPAAPQGQPVADTFDAPLASAVSRFQQRHGLEVTGKVDKNTLEELNVPVQDRLTQIQVNMERWRWMPGSLGDRYILVNVPEFKLDVIEAGKPALTMRVVVGKAQSRTPAFSDKMTYIELNPDWNIPDDIAKNEILPKLAADPGYLESHDMERVPGTDRLRQRAGKDNPLGQIKFMFPNQFDVYLHDTPADHLFDRAERDFSHGCVRLEKPIELAAYLLKDDPKWTPESIQAAIDSGEHETITLKKPLPVHILYYTAFVDPDGTVEFRKDIYGHDAELERALAAEPPVWISPDRARTGQRAAL